MNTVQNFEIFAPKLVDRKEYFTAGHRACQGCGEVLALRLLLKGLGDDVVVANATGCMEIISSAYPQTAWLHRSSRRSKRANGQASSWRRRTRSCSGNPSSAG